MKRINQSLFLFLLLAGLTQACDFFEESQEAIPSPTQFRVFMADTAVVDATVRINGEIISTISYAQQTDYFVAEGDEFRELAVYTSEGALLAKKLVQLEEQQSATYFLRPVFEEVQSGPLKILKQQGNELAFVSEEPAKPFPRKVKVRFMNLTSDAPSEAYSSSSTRITPPDLWSCYPTVTNECLFDFPGEADRPSTFHSDYQLELPGNTTFYLVYGNQPYIPTFNFNNVLLEEGKVYTFILTGAKTSPEELVLTQIEEGNNTPPVPIMSSLPSDALVRYINAGYNLNLRGSTSTDLLVDFVPSLNSAFKTASPYSLVLRPGEYQVSIAPQGTTLPSFFQGNVAFEMGTAYTFYGTPTESNSALGTLLVPEDRTEVDDSIKVRFVNMYEDSPGLEVKVDNANGISMFEPVAFSDYSDRYYMLPVADAANGTSLLYSFVITDQGEQTEIIIETERKSYLSGDVITIVIYGSYDPEDGFLPQVEIYGND